jgi:CheY-like chemotaxis protein/signal recognition particle receptor subunit beta
MALFNHATKEVTAKLVYYGPGLCGKTTNLQWIHEKLNFKSKGKLVSLATQTDRTLFFDFLPVELGTIRGMRTRMQIYTVPGQVFYEATRRMVLKGCDAVVFVADSQAAMLDANFESLQSLRRNLLANEIDPAIPMVIQYNKRDLPTALPVSVLNSRLNPRGLPCFESVAFQGTGVEETLKGITKLLFKSLSDFYGGTEAVAQPAPPEPAAPAVKATSAHVKITIPDPRAAKPSAAAEPPPSRPPAPALPRPSAAPRPASGPARPPATEARGAGARPEPATTPVPTPARPPAAAPVEPAAKPAPSPTPQAPARPAPAATPAPRPATPAEATPAAKAPAPAVARPADSGEVTRSASVATPPSPPAAPPAEEEIGVQDEVPPTISIRSSRSPAASAPPAPRAEEEIEVEVEDEVPPTIHIRPSRSPAASAPPADSPPAPEASGPTTAPAAPTPARAAAPASVAPPSAPASAPEAPTAPVSPASPPRTATPPPAAAPQVAPTRPEPPPAPSPPVEAPPPAPRAPAPPPVAPEAPVARPAPEAPPRAEPALFRDSRPTDPLPRGDGLRSDQWLYLLEGAQRGPIDIEDLVDLVLTSIPENTKVWHPGLEGWVHANRVREIAEEIPPPLPVPGAARGAFVDEDMPDFNTVPPQFRTALIADEDEAFRKYLAMPLAAQGFTIHEAADGSAAWLLAVQHRPWLILADVSMPEVDGFEFCRRVRSHPLLSHTPLLFISGSDKYKERYRALQIGADDFLSKQMPIRELLMRIQLLLTRYSDLGGDEKQAGPAEAAGAFQGRIEVFGAPALLQMSAQGGLSGLFTALAEDEGNTMAVLGFREGQIISAAVGGLSGPEAVYAYLAWEKGSFKFTPGEPGQGEPLAQSVEHLLLEGCRLLDESQRGGEEAAGAPL